MTVTLLRAALGFLHYSGASALARPALGGAGAVFMLHHVFPGGGECRGFCPNYGLEMAPQHLDGVIRMVKSRGYDVVSMDEAADRLEGTATARRRFAVFTLDDGYRDNLQYAAPVFRQHQCPYTIYVAPAITDGSCELWWRALETVIARSDRLACVLDGIAHDLPTATTEEKWKAWRTLYRPLRNMDQHAQRRWIRDLSEVHGLDLASQCRAAAMTWDEVRTIAADPLCTIGAHSIHHYALARLSEDEARQELVGSADRIEAEIGRRPHHFAYPYGDPASAGAREFRLAREAGYRTAVTTRKGLLFAAHKDHLTALPRASLSGKIQGVRNAQTLMEGLAFGLYNGFRKVNVG